MSAGELADHFPVSRPTMSAHFNVLREADLIEPTKIGASIIYQLKLSVLEDALLGFARLFGSEVGGAADPESPEVPEPGSESEPRREGARK